MQIEDQMMSKMIYCFQMDWSLHILLMCISRMTTIRFISKFRISNGILIML